MNVDLLIAGSGGGGLTAALTACQRGLRPLVVEKMARVGGSTAMSSGVVWLPANPLMLRAGVHDSPQLALEYLEAVVGDHGPATSRARKQAYIRGGLEMFALLTQEHGIKFRYCDGWPDYYPHLPGGQSRGRCVDPLTLDARAIGDVERRLPTSAYPILTRGIEGPAIHRALRTLDGKLAVSRGAARSIWSKARGGHDVTMGRALVGRLVAVLQRLDVPIWFESAIQELIIENGRAVGAVVEHEGTRTVVRANAGVVLATGGFSRNDALRRKYQPAPVGAQWTAANAGDTGDGLILAQSVGAATALLDKAWWIPSSVRLDGTPQFVVYERMLPHSLLVDRTGMRFVNEATNYMEVGEAMLHRGDRVSGSLPCWLIIDQVHRDRYVFAGKLPRRTPKGWLDSGFLLKADSIPELATLCQLDIDTLVRTIDRFNASARAGTDDDFERGSSDYDRFGSDPRNRPNSSLGTIQKAPFYAQAIFPGDVGTCGGVLTDEHGRVLKENGEPIDGLYAIGNTAATVFGDKYPGAGASIGQTMVFGYLAATHASRSRRGDFDE